MIKEICNGSLVYFCCVIGKGKEGKGVGQVIIAAISVNIVFHKGGEKKKR